MRLTRWTSSRIKYQSMLSGENDAKKIFAAARAMDGEMRELINGLFGFDVCTPLYGTMNTYAMADGLPVWCNLCSASSTT